MTRDELQELVDYPNETIDVEYKSWLDLSEPVVKAKIARHVAALSNFGGGYIIFGFEDDMSPSAPSLSPVKRYTRDDISGICKKYLSPAPQCDVRELVSARGTSHTIVIVPPHGSVPVCAKANGPLVERQTVGIVQGAYYTRKIGPESAPIVDPNDWGPIIRRCALRERSAILAALNVALQGQSRVQANDEDLKRWHDAASTAFKLDASRHKWKDLELGLVQYSYSVAGENQETIDPSELIEIVRQVNAEVCERVETGWSMFYPFTKDEIAPYFTTDISAIDESSEFLECRPMRNANPSFVDMWRISPTGMATIIRPHTEDDEAGSEQFRRKRGTWLSPDYQFRALAEIVRHAQGMSERFQSPTFVEFRCEWTGLGGREIFHPNANWRAGRKSNSEHRLTMGKWPVASLESDWPVIVAKLGAPLIRVFATDLTLGADWVRSRVDGWRKK